MIDIFNMEVEEIKNLNNHVPKEGVFTYGILRIIVTMDDNKWHFSVSTSHRLPKYAEMKALRYALCPKENYMAEIFPPESEFVNLQEFTRHMFEIDPETTKYPKHDQNI